MLEMDCCLDYIVVSQLSGLRILCLGSLLTLSEAGESSRSEK